MIGQRYVYALAFPEIVLDGFLRQIGLPAIPAIRLTGPGNAPPAIRRRPAIVQQDFLRRCSGERQATFDRVNLQCHDFIRHGDHLAIRLRFPRRNRT